MIRRWCLDWTGSERAPRTGFCGHLWGCRWHGRNSRPDERPWSSEGTAFTIWWSVCACARARVFQIMWVERCGAVLSNTTKIYFVQYLTTGLQRGRIKWNGELTHFGSCGRNSSISDDWLSSGLNIINTDYQKGLGFTAHVLKSQRSFTVAHREWG